MACKNIGILHDKSQPGIPQTNALIERTNQTILTKTIVCLLEAGLPPCYWTFAAPCVCLNLNTEFENGESAYFLTHGEEFPYKRFPFGCKVVFKPSSTKSSETDGKWNAPSSVGIFAGYVMHSGYRSKGEYLVWDLFDFGRGADLSNLASNIGQRISKPHVSTRCELYNDTLHYELKDAYEKVNYTYDGQREALLRNPLKSGKQTDPPPSHVDVQGGGNSADPLEQAVEDPLVPEIPAPVAAFPHMREGKASDKRIYLNDLGVKVMLASNGRPYPVGVDGVRLLPSTRPEGWEREVWKTVNRVHQKQIIDAYKTGYFAPMEKKDVKDEAMPEPAAEVVGGEPSGSGYPGGAPPAAKPPDAALPSLLTSYHKRVANKWLIKSEGMLACAPLGIEGILGDGKPSVSPWGHIGECPVEPVVQAAASEIPSDSTKYESINEDEPWDFWNQVAQQYHSPPECGTNCVAAPVGGDAPTFALLREADGDVVLVLACCLFGVPALVEVTSLSVPTLMSLLWVISLSLTV